MKAIGLVKDDTIILDYEYAMNITKFNGKRIEVDLRPLEKRNIRYNYFYGVICTSLAETLSISVDDARDYLCTMLLSTTRIVAGEEVFITRSVSSLSKEEYPKFIQAAERFLSDKHKIILPSSDTYTQYEQELNASF